MNVLSDFPSKPCCIFFIHFFILLSCFGQDSDNEDFRLLEIEKVTTADFDVPDTLYEDEDGAIYLYHTGRSKLEYDPRGKPELSLTKKFRVLVLNEKGLEMADRAIPLYIGKDKAQTIGAIHGKVYNLENGEVEGEKLKNSDWQIDEYNENYKLARISFRNVKVGSIIELEYVVYDPFVFQMDDWDFQLEEPVVYSQYQVSYPSNFGYKLLKLGYHPLDQSKSFTKRVMRGTGVAANFDYDQVNYLFSAKNIPALRPEPYTDSRENYRATILTELHYFDNNRTGERRFFYKDWLDAVDDYFDEGKNKDFLEAKSLAGFFEPEARNVPDLDEIQNIYNQVRSAIRSSGDEGSIIMDRKPKAIIQSGTGSANEINMLLVSVLRKNEIEAYPFLYAKRDRKKVLSQFPIFSQFKSVMAIAYVEDSYILLDASDLTLKPGEIGEMSYNGEGLSAKPKEPIWFPLKSSMPSKQRCSIELSELDETSVKGMMRVNLSGIYAYRLRNELSEIQVSDLTDYFNLADGVSLEYSDSNVNENVDELEINFTIEIALETFGDSYVFPAIAVEPISTNPFSNKDRKYPVVFSDSWQESYTCLLRLDADQFEVDVPESKSLMLPGEDAELNFAASYNLGSLVVRSSVKMNSEKYELAKYQSLRTFYDHVVGAQSSFIEIQKK